MSILHVLGRAEVLSLLEEGEQEAAAYLIKQLGFSMQEKQSLNITPHSSVEIMMARLHGHQPKFTRENDTPYSTNNTLRPIEASFWVAKNCEKTNGSDTNQIRETMANIQEEAWRNRPNHTPAFYPLVSPKNLLPRLFRLLNREHEGRTPDVKKILAHLEQGKPLPQIPLKKRQSLGRHLHIIVDHNPHLIPYWTDFSLYLQLMESQLPYYAFSHEIWIGNDLIDGWEIPPNNSVVMVFSDLGALSREPNTQLQCWIQLGRQLAQAGNSTIAVIPCHPDECDSRLKNLFTLLPWEPLRRLRKTTIQEREQQANQLLKFLSPALRLEPGLLRSVRLAIAQHGYHFDAGVEALVWQHAEMSDPSSVAATFNPSARQQWLETFAELTDESLKRTVLDTIREWRAGLREEVWFEELVSLDVDSKELADEADLQDAYQYMRNLRSEALLESRSSEFDLRCRWFRRMEKRLPIESWELPEVGMVLQNIAAHLHQKDEFYKSGFAIDPANLDSSNFEERTLPIIQQEQALWVGGEDDDEGGLITGCHLVNIRYRRTLLYCELTPLDSNTDARPIKSSLQFPVFNSNAIKLCDLPDGYELKVRSDIETLFFSQITKPAWAKTITYRRDGLWLEHDCMGNNYLSQWLNPTKNIQGSWEGFPSEIVNSDKYGLFADLNINNITQRFRWIKPGTFKMGSPEDETGSFNGEDLHQVTLTKGFWLADTTVTQAFWLEIMGEEQNPSLFIGAELPVENISWDDCQQFISKLNELLISGVQAQLPTEAQWEYACRAGTATPFSFGDEGHLAVDIVNYSGKWEKHDNSGKTQAVKTYPPNEWGMYEMHGNIWEWCEDYQGQYPAGPVFDPIAIKPDSERILRGGSWEDSGRFCRSASRNSDHQEDSAKSGLRILLSHNLRSSVGIAPSEEDTHGLDNAEDKELKRWAESLSISYEQMELLDKLDRDVSDEGKFGEYWIVKFEDFDSKERPDLEEIMDDIGANEWREVRIDLPMQYFSEPDFPESSEEFIAGSIVKSDPISNEEILEEDDTNMWWDDSAMEAAQSLLMIAEIDEERHQICFYEKKVYDTCVSNYEELINFLSEVAENAGYSEMPRGDGEYITGLDGHGIAYEALENFPKIRDFFEHE